MFRHVVYIYICVCVCVYTYVCITYIYTCIYIYMFRNVVSSYHSDDNLEMQPHKQLS